VCPQAVPAARARPSLVAALTGAARQPRSGTAALEWRSCGSKKDPMQLQQFDVQPNPIKVPGVLKAQMALLVKEAITPPIKVSFYFTQLMLCALKASVLLCIHHKQ
jgi:hypothetical protein